MNSQESPRLNMRQVATIAGVSHQTVSRVVNGHPNISPHTREKVLKVIDSVSYRPNSAARALATNRSKRIGVLVDSAMQYGPNSTVRAVEEVARRKGYAVSSVTVSDSRDISAHDAVEHLMEQGVEALCVVAPRSSSVDLLRELSQGIPTLVIKAEEDASFLTVSVDQRLGAALVVDYLVELGHKNIGHISGPLDWLDARGREAGWRKQMGVHGLDVGDVVVGDWTAEFGYSYGRSMQSIPDCTAFFVANDQMALGLLHGLRDQGIRVPEDVSVVGFDDLPESKHFFPPLTTVRQDFHALGTQSIENLLAVVEGRDAPKRSLIAPLLVVRESTAPPR